MADQLEGARTLPVKFIDEGDGSVAERIAAAGYRWNGSGWDQEQGNVEGLLLPSLARTAPHQTPVQTNPNARGVLIRINVTAAGTSYVEPLICAATFDRTAFPVLLDGPQITTTGWFTYIVYPGTTPASSLVSSRICGAASAPLPRSWLLSILRGDSSSWTYDATYDYIV